MINSGIKIFPLGDAALTVSFGNEISPALNNKVLSLAQVFEENRFAGFVEVVPAYASLSIFYDVPTVRKNFPAFARAFDAVKNFAENLLQISDESVGEKSRLIKIPVNFSNDCALDLESLAAQKNLPPEEVIEIFLAETYRVYMLGFLPGFAYMGEVDGSIAAPRKSTPRAEVPKGSVGIAGRQTGIYSLASPGGWQIVGRTDVELFTPDAAEPTFLRAGDRVKFYSIKP